MLIRSICVISVLFAFIAFAIKTESKRKQIANIERCIFLTLPICFHQKNEFNLEEQQINIQQLIANPLFKTFHSIGLIDEVALRNHFIKSEYKELRQTQSQLNSCLLYTSDAADERSSVDLGGRRIIKKKKKKKPTTYQH